MGNNKIRRLIKSESKWTDKSAKKHKHNFSETVLIYIHGNENKHIFGRYYTANKCKYCNSFINAKFTTEIPNLPIISFTTPHFSIEFNDIFRDSNHTLD